MSDKSDRQVDMTTFSDAGRQSKVDLSKLLSVVTEATVVHSAYRIARERLYRCISRRIAGRNTCIAAIAESGCGKTHLMKDILRAYRRLRDKEGLTCPIVYCITPAQPSAKALAKRILTELGAMYAKGDSEEDLTTQIKKLIREAGVLVLIIDEFQQLYHNASERVMGEACDFLKNLVELTGVTLIVTGLPDCTAVIGINQQLIRRFEAPVELFRFDWRSKAGRTEFVAVLKAFGAALSKYIDMPDLGNPEMAFRFYCASGGLMGYVVKILLGAAELVWESSGTQMTLEIMHAAFVTEVWSDASYGPRDVAPFSEDFKPTVSEDLLQRVRRIGTSSAALPQRRASKGSRKSKGAE